MESAGTSSTEATRWLANAGLQLRLHEVAGVLEGDAVEDVAEETLDEHPLSRLFGDAARLQVEEVLRVDGAHRRPVSAAHIVVVDLQHRDRGRLRLVGEDKVAVRLVGIRARGVLFDL